MFKFIMIRVMIIIAASAIFQQKQTVDEVNWLRCFFFFLFQRVLFSFGKTTSLYICTRDLSLQGEDGYCPRIVSKYISCSHYIINPTRLQFPIICYLA